MAISVQQQSQLLQMAVGLFNAAPGVVYMNQFATTLNNGVGIVDLFKSLVNSPAFVAIYPAFDTNKDFSSKYINTLLGNTVSAANKTWATNWMASQLDAGSSRADAVLSVLIALLGISPNNPDWGAAVQQFNNRVAVAEYYTITKNGTATDLITLQGTLASVNSDTTSINQAKAQIDSALTPVNNQIFTLTAANAVLSGTGAVANVSPVGNLSLNDDIINVPSAAILSGSTIVDASSSDNDVINITLVNASSAAPVISKIETIKVDSYSGGELNFSGITGHKNTIVTGTAFSAKQIAAGQTIALSGVSGSQSFVLSNATANDSITFNLLGTVNGASLITSDSGGGAIENINLNVQSSSILGLSDMKNQTTVSITGNGSLTLNDSDMTSSIINATSLLGNLNYTQLVATNKTIAGSAGNDTFTFGLSGALTSADVINGGAGKDTLVFIDAGSTNDFDNVTNIEIVKVLSGANANVTTVDSLVGFGQTLTVDASALTTVYSLNWNGSAETNGTFSITGGNGSDTIVGGAGPDTIAGGAGNNAITGGSGGDVIDIGSGNDVVIYTGAAQTFAGTVTSGVTILTGVDVINGMTTGDALSIYGAAGISTNTVITTGALLNAGTLNAVSVVRGNYNTVSNIFTINSAGNDSLVQWDSDGVGSVGVVESVVLTGFTGNLFAANNTLSLTGSSVPGGGGSSSGGASNTVNVAGAGSATETAATNTTFNLSQGDYVYTISGFGSGDKLIFPKANLATIVNSSYTDGVIDVQYASGGQTVLVHLTGISTALDSGVFGVNSFNGVFGVGSLI